MRILIFVAIGLGLFSTIGAAGCGPTCPGNDPNCGTSNIGAAPIAGAAGAAGTTGSSSCQQLSDLEACMTAFCATVPATNPFCNCFKKTPQFDLNTVTCLCVPFDPQKFCDDQAASGVTYDCSSATGAVGTACVNPE